MELRAISMDGEGVGVVAPAADVASQAAHVPRSNRPEVRNPLLSLKAAAKIAALPKEARAALREVLMELRKESMVKAEHCWKKRKAPLATYHRAVGVYAGHIARLTRDKKPGQ